MEAVKKTGGNKSMSFHPTTRLDPPAGTHVSEERNLFALLAKTADILQVARHWCAQTLTLTPRC